MKYAFFLKKLSIAARLYPFSYENSWFTRNASFLLAIEVVSLLFLVGFLPII